MNKKRNSTEMTPKHEMVRCPYCGALTDNLGYHWAVACPESELKIPSIRKNQKEFETFEIIHGRSNVYEKIDEMIEDSHNAIRVKTTTAGLKRMYKRRERKYKAALKRGVKLYIIAKVTKDNLYVAMEFAKMGAYIRNLNRESSIRLVNVDRRKCMMHFTTQDNTDIFKGDDVGVYTANTLVSKFIAMNFDELWLLLSSFEYAAKKMSEKQSYLI